MVRGADIGIDLGTANVLVYVNGKGIVLEEPSVVAIEKRSNTVLAVGEEARRMIGRTPGNIVAIRPLRDGVISDYDVTEKMLTHYINKVVDKKGFARFFMPRIMVCVPTGVTEVEKRAVEEATRQAGAREVYIIEEPIAAAIGSSIRKTCLAPEETAASTTAFSSIPVTALGTQIQTFGLITLELYALFIKYFTISLVRV